MPGILRRDGAPGWVRLFALLVGALLLCRVGWSVEAEIVETRFEGDVQSAREALVEVIEGEGLVVSGHVPFGDMLARTGPTLGKVSPYRHAEIIQFCSAALAHQMVAEAASQIALCPLSIALYAKQGERAEVTYAYRPPPSGSPGRDAARQLLDRLVSRAALLAKTR